MAIAGGAIVTGGAGGIGFAIAERLAADGWRIGLLDRELKPTEAAAAKIKGAVPLAADVTDETACQGAVAAFGAVDLLVNNAGIGRFGKLHELSTADFRLALDINLAAPYIMSKAAVHGMIARGRGIIINITSITALAPAPGTGAYTAAKAGLARLTEQMALEWSPLGIRVNSIAPGFIDAGISKPIYAEPEVRARRGAAVPLKRLGLAADVAEAAAFLASEKADYINGHQLVVDGGVTPSLLLQLPREAKA